MSAHSLRHDDGPVQHIMTTPAAHSASASNGTTERKPTVSQSGYDITSQMKTERDMERGERRSKKLDKRSTEYLIKSGIAGGIAGCAVSGPKSAVEVTGAWIHDKD
jgi:solute carrier family 25 (mitochondrial carrier protein), member 16